jgi:hypothetical protein
MGHPDRGGGVLCAAPRSPVLIDQAREIDLAATLAAMATDFEKVELALQLAELMEPRLLIRGSQTGVCVYNLNLAHLLNEPPRVGITEEHVIPDSCRATWNPRQTQERFRRSVYAQSPCLLFDRLFE